MEELGKAIILEVAYTLYCEQYGDEYRPRWLSECNREPHLDDSYGPIDYGDLIWCIGQALGYCKDCGEDHNSYFDCNTGYDVRDSDWFGATNRYGG